MTDSQIIWTIGSISTAGAALIGIIYRLGSKNAEKLNTHDVLFAKLEYVPDTLDKLVSKIDTLAIDIAVLKNRSHKDRITDIND